MPRLTRPQTGRVQTHLDAQLSQSFDHVGLQRNASFESLLPFEVLNLARQIDTLYAFCQALETGDVAPHQ